MTDQSAPRARAGLDCSDSPSLTKQSHRDECDINMIVARFDKTGLLTHVRENAGQYGDVSEVGSYREAIHRVRLVEESFMQLSAVDRAKFNNDPARYLDWAATAPTEEPEDSTPVTTPPEPPAVPAADPDPLQMDHETS